LIDQGQPEWKSRSHFFSFAAHLMRQVLVDYARSQQAAKRGAGRRVSLDDAEPALPERSADVMALDEALTRLASFDERKAKALELRFFAGMSLEETAEALGVSPRTVDREMRMARAWLYKALGGV